MINSDSQINMIHNIQFFLAVIAAPTVTEVSKGISVRPRKWEYCHKKERPDIARSSFRSGFRSDCQDEWRGICRSGKSQSPINIVSDYSVMTKTYEAFQFTTNRHFFTAWTVENTGHTVRLVPERNASDYYTMSKVT